MKYTPFSIKNQEFNKSVRGFDKDEVHAFLEKLADEFERLQFENEKLVKQNDELNEQIQEFRKIEKNLQSTLINAHESSSKAVESAKKQTQLILKEGELKAAQLIENAKTEAEKIRNSVIKLKEEKHLLLARLKTMIESQTSLLDIEIHDEDEIPAVEQTLKQPKKNDSSEINVDDILEKLL
ncbi:MAG: DivIVA domain-containing protein [Bacteroidetes bacterium]|nr:DivIVA domain-containing protein [Bacteroidota bacterium]